MGPLALVCASSPPSPHGHHGRRALQHRDHLSATGWEVVTCVHPDPGPDGLSAHPPPHEADLVVAVGWRASPATITRGEAPLILDAAEVEFPAAARRSMAGARGPLPLDGRFAALLTAELAAYARARVVITATRSDAALVDDVLGAPGLALVVPTAVAAEEPGPSGRHGLVFVADLDDDADADAAEWLCRQVVPALPAALVANHPLVIVSGSVNEGQRRLLSAAGVTVEHAEPDVTLRLATARTALVPPALGARGHHLAVTALVADTPVVCSPRLASWLPEQMRRRVFEATRPHDFAGAVEAAAHGDPTAMPVGLRAALADQSSADRAHMAFAAAVEAALCGRVGVVARSPG